MELFWLTFEVIAAFLGLALGIALLVFSSNKAGGHSIGLASPFIIGLLLVSISTNLPKIANAITSSVLDHGNITVREILATSPKQFDPRKILGPAEEATEELITGKIRLFGSSFKVS